MFLTKTENTLIKDKLKVLEVKSKLHYFEVLALKKTNEQLMDDVSKLVDSIEALSDALVSVSECTVAQHDVLLQIWDKVGLESVPPAKPQLTLVKNDGDEDV